MPLFSLFPGPTVIQHNRKKIIGLVKECFSKRYKHKLFSNLLYLSGTASIIFLRHLEHKRYLMLFLFYELVFIN